MHLYILKYFLICDCKYSYYNYLYVSLTQFVIMLCSSWIFILKYFIFIHSFIHSITGTTVKKTCPSGTVINKLGAKSVAECDKCPGGFICPQGAVIPKLCNPGHYCEFNQAIKVCPKYTYNDKYGAADLNECLPCPAGYWCNAEGTANYTSNGCMPGYYCPPATPSPIPCPAGTYR